MSILKDKIESLIQGLSLTPMRFADIIEVKRPIMSHILTGRNNPSLDVILKIVEKFPELGYDWISDDIDIDYKVIRKIRDTYQLDNNAQQSLSESSNNGSLVDLITNDDKPIEKIIFFYSDGSFKVYNP